MVSKTRKHKLWPIHLKPQSDELFSSWLIRMAHAHLLKSESLCTELIGRQGYIWTRDIDKSAPDELIEAMSQVTGTPLVQAQQTLLTSLNGYLTERIHINGHTKALLSLSKIHRVQKQGLPYCPLCLTERAYFKRLWRISWATVCTTHKIQLRSTCNHCGTPVAPHRHDMVDKQYIPNADTIVTCPNCSHRLMSGPITKAEDQVVQLQLLFEKGLTNGYLSWGSNPSLYSHLFFDGISILISAIMSQRYNFARAHPQEVLPLTSTDISSSPVSERYMVMQKLSTLLENWPHSFISYLERRRASDIINISPIRPYWLDAVLSEKKRRASAITNNEIQSIHQVLKKTGQSLTGNNVRRLTGRHQVEGIIERKPTRTIFWDIARLHTTLESLDHQIAETFDLRERHFLIQLKFMLVVRHLMKLTIAQMIELQTDHLSSQETEPPSFELMPETVIEAQSWLYYFIQRIRPKLIGSGTTNAVFLSKFGQSMSKTRISCHLNFSSTVLR